MRKASCMGGMTMALFLFGACESFVNGIDEDDITRAQDAELRYVVTSAQLNYMGTLEGDLARLCGLWSGYFVGVGGRQPASYYGYNVSAVSSNGWWNSVYAASLKNIRIGQQKAMLLDNRSTLGMFRVMEASLLGTAAALWGDVPFSQAVSPDQYPDPRFDSQVEVVDKLVVLLDSAIVNLQSTSLRTGDFLHGGTTPNTNWILAAQSVKARLLLYRKDYSNALTAANAGIQLPANDLVTKHGTTAGERNLYYEFLVTSAWAGEIKATDAWLGRLLSATTPESRNHAKTNEAARLARYYSGTSPSNYLPNTGASGFFAQAAPLPLHSAAETKLIAAECHLRLGDFVNALSKLNEHRANLRASYPTGTYSNFVATDFDAGGIENATGALTPNETLLLEIQEEKYVSLYGQVEVFNEIRRTGNALGIPANAGAERPQRLLYPQTEINSNANIPLPIPAMNKKTMLFE